jgi:uncharacterized protein (TIGR04255 family)
MIDLALDQYRKVAAPTAIQRIGLRFINSISVEKGLLRHEELLDFYPHIGPGLPQTVNSFLCGVGYEHADARDLLRMQVSTVVDAKTTQPAVNLDLDYFTAKPASVQFAEVDSWLESAHAHVEQAFEGAITEKLRQRFEPEPSK